MARLRDGEKNERKGLLANIIRYCGLGLTEAEIAEETGLDRRTVNNYLRELDEDGHAHKKGRKWFPF